MYRIVRDSDGVELGVTEHVMYIKISAAGSYIEAAQEDAIGVAYQSIAYNLFGHSDIPDAETVLVLSIDAGERIGKVETQAADLAAQLATADETAIELYEAQSMQEEINLAQDEALIEIYEMLG